MECAYYVRPSARRYIIRWLILVAWCGFLFFYGLSGPLYRTESLRAIIGQSALDGHWLTPTLYGEPFLTKPPGAYAAIGLASIPFGQVTEVSARLPSAFAALLTVLFAFAMLRKILGEQRAFLAALALPISMLWLDKVPSAEIDILQLAWVTLAIFCLHHAVKTREGSGCSGWHWWLAALLCVAGGFLTKWTAPAFFYLAAVPFLWARGHLRWLFCPPHLLACGFAVALCVTWALLVANEVSWSTLSETVYKEGAQRFVPKARGKPYPWLESLTFPAVVLAANLPWAIPALWSLRLNFMGSLAESERRLVQLLHCWAWPNLIFWSLPAQHNVRYVLPICPAITLLGVIVLMRWAGRTGWKPELPSAQVSNLSRRYHLKSVICILIAWIALKIVFVEGILPSRSANRNARETGEQLSTLVPDDEILYLCRLKDEGVLFYYGRPARRFAMSDRPAGYAILLDEEWKSIDPTQCDYVSELHDQQQDRIHLVRFHPATKEARGWQQPPTPPKSSASPP